MFKKRLKGLLAMVLAGSIAMTALPLSASATIETIYVGDGNYSVHKDQILEGSCTEEPFNSNCTQDNLWAYYAESTYSGKHYLGSTPGNSLDDTLTDLDAQKHPLNPELSDKHDVYLRYSHDVIFIDSAPSVSYDPNKKVSITDFSKDAQTDVATIAETLGLVTPLQSVSSWTAYYGYTNGAGDILDRSLDGICYPISGTPKITKEIIEGLYSGNDSMESYLKFGAVFIVPEISDKTFNLPVLNTFGGQEMNGDTPKTIPITNEIGDIDGGKQFYLCYGNEVQGDAVSTNGELWNKIVTLAGNMGDSFNDEQLFLLRYAQVTVRSNGEDKGYFTSREYYNYLKSGTPNNDAIKYAFIDAKPKSIWRVAVPFYQKWYFADKEHIYDAINSCLSEYPKANSITFTEQTTIDVTGTTPTAGGSIARENNFFTQTLKEGSLKTISDLLADLTAKIPPASGKKYDVTGWELWSADTDCGGLINLENTNFNTSGVTGVTADMFDKAGSKYPVIYFPQVDATSSGGGNSGGGNSGGGNSGGGSSSSRPTTPAYDPNKPMIDGEEKSWSDVAKDIGKMTEGENKTIYLGGDKKIPADVIKAIKDSKAVITFRISTAFSWTVDGSTLTDGDIHDYDFSIELITATGTELIRGMVGVGFTIGDITDKATLNINFKTTHSGEFANLYKMVDGELIFVDNVKIDEKGAAIGLEISEAGDYVVMLGKFSDRAGDMDNDGILNSKDSLAVINNFLGIEEGANPLVSDMNGDGFINSKDALIIIQKFLGIE